MLEDWVIDLGNITTKLVVYNRTIALYWFVKNMTGKFMWERQQKEEGDDVPEQNWKEHHLDT